MNCVSGAHHYRLRRTLRRTISTRTPWIVIPACVKVPRGVSFALRSRTDKRIINKRMCQFSARHSRDNWNPGGPPLMATQNPPLVATSTYIPHIHRRGLRNFWYF